MSIHSKGVRIALAALAGLLLSVPALAESQARIVRLSYVEGEVQIDRNGGQGFERAFLNLPVVQGTRLRTGMNGFAEVEFEDGSTLRLTSNTRVGFPQLKLNDAGAKVSSMEVQQGMVYVSFAGAKDNQFSLAFGPESLTLAEPVHFRLDTSRSKAALAVFKGDVQVNGPGGIAMVGKKETLNFDFVENGQFALAKKVADAPYDSWDKDQDDYNRRYARNSPVTNSPYSYGLSDLNYYGNFFSVPGFGTVWQPFFTGAGWDPFMAGAWAWYPDAGYSWVSQYPWGWTPYHYGTWQSIPNYGWVWQPGGAWTGLGAFPRPVNPPTGFSVPQPPASSRSLVVVNRGPVLTPAGGVQGGMVISRNTAGLGITRGSLDDLKGASSHAQRHGMATAAFRAAPSASAYNPGMSSPGTGTRGTGGRGRTPSPSSRPSPGSWSNSGGSNAGSHNMAPPSMHGSTSSGAAPSGGTGTRK